jgi:acyl CoA:acetate/3-ketoacid CoA transferase
MYRTVKYPEVIGNGKSRYPTAECRDILLHLLQTQFAKITFTPHRIRKVSPDGFGLTEIHRGLRALMKEGLVQRWLGKETYELTQQAIGQERK